MILSFAQLIDTVESIHELIWGRFTWCGQRTAPENHTLLVTFEVLDMRQWVSWKGWTAVEWGLQALFLTLQMIPQKIFSKSVDAAPLKSIQAATSDLVGSLVWSISMDLNFCLRAGIKAIFYGSHGGGKYISCCKVFWYTGEKSPLHVRVHLRLDGVSVVVSCWGQWNMPVTGLTTLSDWDSLLPNQDLGIFLFWDDIALPERWERASLVLKDLKDLLMPLSRFLKKKLIKSFAMNIFTMTHHPGKSRLSA